MMTFAIIYSKKPFFKLFTFFPWIYEKKQIFLVWKWVFIVIKYDYSCTRWTEFSTRESFNVRDEKWIDYFPFESFPWVQFLLIILSVKITYISNGS